MKGFQILFMVLLTAMLSSPILMNETEEENEKQTTFASTPTFEVLKSNMQSRQGNLTIGTTLANMNEEGPTKTDTDEVSEDKNDAHLNETNRKSKILAGKGYMNATHRNINGMIINMNETIEFINATHVKINGIILNVDNVFPNFYNPGVKTNESSVTRIKDVEQFKSVFNQSNGFINETHRIVDGMIVNLNNTYNFTDETHLDVNGHELEVYKVYPMFPRVKISQNNTKDKNGTRSFISKETMTMMVSITKQLLMAWYKRDVYNPICGHECLNPYYGVGIIPSNYTIGTMVLVPVPVMPIQNNAPENIVAKGIKLIKDIYSFVSSLW